MHEDNKSMEEMNETDCCIEESPIFFISFSDDNDLLNNRSSIQWILKKIVSNDFPN